MQLVHTEQYRGGVHCGAEELKIARQKWPRSQKLLGGGFIQFIIRPLLLACSSNADKCQTGSHHLIKYRLTDGKGEELVQLSKSTVRSVGARRYCAAVIQSSDVG